MGKCSLKRQNIAVKEHFDSISWVVVSQDESTDGETQSQDTEALHAASHGLLHHTRHLHRWNLKPKSLVEGDGERKMREFKDKLLKDQEALGGRGDTQEKTKPGMLRSKSNLTESTL